MTAKEAYKLASNYKDPKTFKEVIKQIKVMAKYEQTCAIVKLTKNRKSIIKRLKRLGYFIIQGIDEFVYIEWGYAYE